MNLSNNGQRLFYRVDFLKITVWVPLGNQSEDGLRPITPKIHHDRYSALLKISPVSLDGDYHKRRSELEKRMNKGTFQNLCEVVRDLNGLNSKKPVSYFEKTLFIQAHEALVLEWSMTSGVSQLETIAEIDESLEIGK